MGVFHYFVGFFSKKFESVSGKMFTKSGFFTILYVTKSGFYCINISVFQYFRTALTPKFASICIAAITFLSLAASMPMYFLAHIRSIEEFQKPFVYEDILICKSTWSRNERVIYNTGSCVLQFLIPFWFIVSSF